MVGIRILEVGIEASVEFDGHEPVVGQLRGIDEAQEPAGAAEGLVIGGEEEGEAVAGAGRGGVDVGDGEGECCGERSGGVGDGVAECDGVVVNGGAGAGGGDAELLGEADDAVPEMGIADESEVSEAEGTEIEGCTVCIRRREEDEENGEEEKLC